jgi:hypothetical protein
MCAMTIRELPAELRTAFHQTINRGLMVRFINADLFSRAGLDVRKSFLLYDEAGVFEWALPKRPSDEMMDRLAGAGSRTGR